MDYEYDGVDEEFGGRILWGRVGILAVALLFMFAIGRCTAGGGVPEEDFELLASERAQLASEVEQQQILIEDLQDRIRAEFEADTTPASPQPGTTGTVDPTQPSPTPTGTAAAGPAAGSTYVVQDGDTLYGIAETVYGDPQLFQLIADANGITASNPLQVGDILEIPPRPAQ